MRIVYFILLLLIPSLIYSQNNLISNGGFEYRDFLVGADKPDDQAQIRKADKWKEDQKCWLFSGCAHTPDWLYGLGHAHVYYVAGTNTVPIAAATQLGHAGMTCGELIEQKLDNDLIFGKRYRVSMNTRITTEDLIFNIPGNDNPAVGNATSWSGASYMNIILGKEKIKYENDEADFCSEDWLEKSNPSHEYTTAASTPIEGSSTQWQQISTEFIVLDDGYDWVAFEFVPNIDYNYLLIDDIELVEVTTPCADCQGCDPTDGCIDVTSNNIHKYIDDQCSGEFEANPLTLFGLENISYLKWEILPVNGASAIRAFEIQNPRGTISWDGKDENGLEIPDGNYEHRYIVANSCEGKQFVDNFTKAVNVTSCDPNNPVSNETPTSLPGMNYNSVEKIDYNDDCCYECIILDNSTGYPILSGEQSFVAINKINIGPNLLIEEGTSLTLQAGESVNFIGGNNSITISSLNNAESIIEIVEECDPPGITQMWAAPSHAITSATIERTPLNFSKNEDASVKHPTFSTNNHVEQVEFEVFPIPSEGEFFVKCESCFADENMVRIALYNSLGSLVYEKLVNSVHLKNFGYVISVENSGIYFITLNDREKKFTKKLIVK